MAARGSTAPTWRYIILVACIAVGLLWASSQLLATQSCQHERERALQAEALALKVHAEREQALEQRVAELQVQLSEALGKRGVAAGEGNFQQTLVETLQAEVALLRGQKDEFDARLRGSQQQVAVSSAPLMMQVPDRPQMLQGGHQGHSPEEVSASGASFASDFAAGPITEEQLRSAAQHGAIGVVVISCKRTKYLSKAMESILKANRDPRQLPLVISQDGYDTSMTEMIKSSYVDQGLAYHMHHEHETNAAEIARRFGGSAQALGYVRIAQHFGFAMRRMFDGFGFQQVIFLEEDMEISPDFFSYFAAMLQLLRADSGLFCVSAWNDNGYASLVQDARAAFRTDFFPGLGWMMQKSMWDEVRDRWAVAYWDEFMRRPDVRKGRQCIRPEISRSFTFGEEGTSGGQFFATHLQHIRLNTELIDWAKEDLRHLASAEAFDGFLALRLREALRVDLFDIDQHVNVGRPLRIEYDDQRDYARVAQKFGLMPDEKEGIRRMSYRGVIPFAWRGSRVYLHTRQWPGGLS